jgi:hypothetical protein
MREVEQIGIGCDLAPFDVEQFRKGMNVEPEHGPHDLVTNVTDDDPDVTGEDRARAPGQRSCSPRSVAATRSRSSPQQE